MSAEAIGRLSGQQVLAQMGSQAGKRFLITGANSGIGYSTAVELARRGAIVLLACRDLKRGTAALAKLRVDATGECTAAAQAEVVELNLASLDSIDRLSRQLVAESWPLHGLINNAGVLAPPKRELTEDGFELQFGTNVLGHFALTCRLMPALLAARGAVPDDRSRIVTVASIAHKRCRLDFDDLQAERRYSPMGAYKQSKLADLMFALALERRLRASLQGAISLAVHPGVAKTNLFKVGSSKGLARIAERLIAGTFGVVLNSELQGAIPTLFAATSPDAVGGGYYGSQKFFETRGGDVGLAKIAAPAKDVAAQDRLWSICEELTGMTLP